MTREETPDEKHLRELTEAQPRNRSVGGTYRHVESTVTRQETPDEKLLREQAAATPRERHYDNTQRASVSMECPNENDVSDLRGVQPFRDQGEVVDAMSDPKYKTNSFYRHEVNKRIAAMGK